MNAISFVLSTRPQWNALNATGICSSSSAQRRFQDWTEAGVFEQFWWRGLLAVDTLPGIDWSWLALDGTMTKALLGGEKTGANPTDRGKGSVKLSLLVDAQGMPLAVASAGANRHDMKLVSQMLADLPTLRPMPTSVWPQR